MLIKIILFLVIFFNLMLGIFVLSHNSKSLNNRLFSTLAFLGAFWCLADYMIDAFPSILWLESSYALGALVISTGLIWTLVITENKLKPQITIISVVGIVFFISSFIPDFIVKPYGVVMENSIITGGPSFGLALYTCFYIITMVLILWKLFHCLNTTTNNEKKHQIKHILIGAVITLIISALNAFVLPYMLIPTLGAVDSIGFLIFLTFIAYAITKHRLFSIRVVTIELAVFGLWIFVLTRIFTATTTHEIIIESIFLLVTVILGILLVRSTIYEMTQCEKIERLTKELEEVKRMF